MKTFITLIVATVLVCSATIAYAAQHNSAEPTIRIMAIDSVKADQCLTIDRRNNALVVLADLHAGFQWIMEPWAFVVFAKGTSLVFQRTGTTVTLKFIEVVNFDNETIVGWARSGECV